MISWQHIKSKDDIPNVIEESKKGFVLIFKHSTTCGTSAAVLKHFENEWKNDTNVKPYYLDLLQHRDASNEVANVFEVTHQSPQVLLIENGKCIYHSSHYAIQATTVKSKTT